MGTRHQCSDESKGRLRLAFHRYGGSVRVLYGRLGRPEDSRPFWIRLVKTYDSGLSLELKGMLAARTPVHTDEVYLAKMASYKIVRAQPMEGLVSRGFQLVCINANILQMLHRAVESTDSSVVRKYLKAMLAHSLTHTAAGHIFEYSAHSFFKRIQGKFKGQAFGTLGFGKPLDGGSLLSGKSYQFRDWVEFDNLKKFAMNQRSTPKVATQFLNNYLLPIGKTLAAIDSLLFTEIDFPLEATSPNSAKRVKRVVTVMFQITAGERHGLNLQGMKFIHDNIPGEARKEAVLIFLLPQGVDYTAAQPYQTAASLTTIDQAWPNGKVYQYVLSLPDDDLYENKQRVDD